MNVMYCILFEFTIKYVVKYFKILFCECPWVPMDNKKICGYSNNGYLHGYGDEYEMNIYPTDRVWRTTTCNTTRSVDILVLKPIQCRCGWDNVLRDHVLSYQKHPLAVLQNLLDFPVTIKHIDHAIN